MHVYREKRSSQPASRNEEVKKEASDLNISNNRTSRCPFRQAGTVTRNDTVRAPRALQTGIKRAFLATGYYTFRKRHPPQPSQTSTKLPLPKFEPRHSPAPTWPHRSHPKTKRKREPTIDAPAPPVAPLPPPPPAPAMPAPQIQYSEKYYDDLYEYR